MHPVQSQLYADHYNHLRLLRFLEVEVDCFESGKDWHARLPIILEIFDYLHAYPEARHHPIEDAAFELLLKKGKGTSEDILGIRAEHVKLEELTRTVNQLFLAVANDVVVSKDELVAATKEFLNRQFDHVYKENIEFYPLFEKVISDDEWNEIIDQVEKRFGTCANNKLREEYRQLYKTILQFDKNKNPEAIARAINSIVPGGSEKSISRQAGKKEVRNVVL